MCKKKDEGGKRFGLITEFLLCCINVCKCKSVHFQCMSTLMNAAFKNNIVQVNAVCGFLLHNSN